jgi:SAM-dependent methyltransferase
MTKQVSQMDIDHLGEIRNSVDLFIRESAEKFDGKGKMMLDVAPQDWLGAAQFFKQSTIETLDIDPKATATYIADLTEDNSNKIPAGRFDIVLCTEVLEHVLQPFDAVKEIHRILKPGGVALITTPYNFRIHGPLPDCWRFTEHGLRALFSKGFEVKELVAVETEDRFLMPIHYRLVAQKL